MFRYLEIIGRQRLMKANLHRILTCFHESGIPAAVLKGPYLAASYAKPALRTFSDIDLLIPQSRLGDALSALRYDPGVRSVPPKKPRADKRDIPIHDPSGFVFNLDLHWDLFSYTQLLGCADGATSWAWDNAVPDPEHEIGPLWHLPPEVRLAFLSAHSVLDHRFRLILFRDLAEVTRNEADWDATHDFASRWGLRSVTHLALRIAKDVANAPISEKRLVELRPHALIMTAAESFLRRADLVHFVGHSPHPLNLAIVLLHDSRLARIRLALRRPLAVPSWLSRVTSGQNLSAAQRPIIGRPSRILHVRPTDVARGAQMYAKAMRDSLDSADVEHRIVTIFRSRSASLRTDVDLAVSHGLGRRLGFSPTALSRLRRKVKRWQPDVLVAHGGEALKYAAFVTTPPAKLAYYKIGTAEELRVVLFDVSFTGGW